jgi:hypothetical protein
MQLTKFDALAALLATATSLAVAEDGSRTEILTQPAPCVDAAPVSAAPLYKAYAPDLSDR